MNSVWIFDVDGVITDLQKKQVQTPQLFPLLTKRLENREPVIFNTGRDINWVLERVIKPWQESAPEEHFSHVFLIGEKGGTWQEIGKEIIIDDRFRIPLAFQNDLRKLIADEFSDTMFFDENKKTMISVEMKNEEDIDTYHGRQEELVLAILSLLKKHNLENLTIDKSNISTDIQHPEVGKGFGIKRALTWLEEQKHQPDNFYCFGDSFSDLEMGEELHRQEKPFTYVYAGIKENIDPTSYPFTIHFTKAQFDKGTVEFLKENS